MSSDLPQRRPLFLVGLGLVLALGIFLRLPASLFDSSGAPLHALAALHPTPGFNGVGFDENLYRRYVESIIRAGLGNYPTIVDRYIEVQKTLPGSILPPIRFFYIFSAYLWHQAFGTEPLAALHDVASLFSVLTLLLSTIFAWRLKGAGTALGVAALMSVAPTQLHMSQHALVDGFFTFWALVCLWMLWENLVAPRDWRWLISYSAALCCLVLTKENAFFVFVGLLVIMIANRWLQFGVVRRELLLCTVMGPLLGIVILIFLAGGLDTLRTTYELSVSKNYQLAYAILTGDGPWHRYLVDLLLVSPIVLLLAVAAVFHLDRTQKPELFLSLFLAGTYLIMCNVRYGMNLRYANMWDMPLRILAFSQLAVLFESFARHRALLVTASVAVICAFELRQYLILSVQFPLYELVTEGLMRALHILKTP